MVRGPLLDERDNLRLFLVKKLFTADQIQSAILRGLGDPGGGIFWHAIIGPHLQGSEQRFLDHVLSQLESVNAENARQDGNQLPGLVAKKVFRQAGNFPA
jgi:hypothetical protein